MRSIRLTAGFDHLAAVMAVTLGPTQGPILNALSRGSVELVSDAGTVARRIVEVPDRGRNAGAMILRHLSWQMHERFGDGAATAAVLSRAMVAAGVARIAAGVEPGVESSGVWTWHCPLPSPRSLQRQHRRMISAVLEATATGITGDPELAAVLAEIIDIPEIGAAIDH